MFLASSLNVELVYIILTGVTRFAKLKDNDGGHSILSDDFQERTEIIEDASNESSTLLIKEILI